MMTGLVAEDVNKGGKLCICLNISILLASAEALVRRLEVASQHKVCLPGHVLLKWGHCTQAQAQAQARLC